MINKNLLRIIRIFVGVSIFVLIYYKLGFQDILSSILNIGFIPIFMFAVLFFIFTTVGAICLKIIIDSMSKRMDFFKILQYYIMSWSIGQFTPGNLGEFSIIFFLRNKKDIKTGKALAISVADKIITFALIFIIGIISMFFYFPLSKAIYLATIISIASFFVLFFIFNSKIRDRIFKLIFKKSEGVIKEFDREIKKFFIKRKKEVVINFTLTVIKWLILFLGIKLLFDFSGASISIYHISAIVSISTIISLIPISVSGLGIREASGIYLFELVGISAIISGTVFGIFLLVRYTIAFLIFISSKIGPEMFINELMALRKKDGK